MALIAIGAFTAAMLFGLGVQRDNLAFTASVILMLLGLLLLCGHAVAVAIKSRRKKKR